MKAWEIHYTDGVVGVIEADQITVGGSVLMFVRLSEVTNANGERQGSPIAFVDVSNPGVRCVRESVEAVVRA